MNFLVTGGCGFIGTSLIKSLLSDEHHNIRAFDNLSVGSLEDLARVGEFNVLNDGFDASNWDSRLALVQSNILEREMLIKAAAGADVIFHLAANTGVEPSVKDPLADCNANVIGTVNALEAAKGNNVKRFVFASSGAPVGVQKPPLHEEMAPHPASPYGASKLAGEGYCSAYFHSYGVETVCLRFGNVYGGLSHHKSSVVAKFIKQSMMGETLTVYGDGSHTRDFIHVSDIVSAMTSAALLPEIGGEVFQIATAKETTISELLATLVPILEQKGIRVPKIVYADRRVGDVLRNYSDTSKAKRLLKWQSKVSLSDGLTETVSYFNRI